MARGSMFWGKTRGKLGETILSVVNGQQITRKYQAQVINPKSTAQMLQRIKFANAVKFYKHATQNFFQFAYEDKRKTESYYNAFMRHNTGKAILVTRDSYNDSSYPAMGIEYEMTSGSLPSLDLTAPSETYAETTTAKMFFQLNLHSSLTTGTTWGEVSSELIDQGYANGDIITLVYITTGLTSISESLGNPIRWKFAQAVINSSSSNAWNSNSVWSYRGYQAEQEFDQNLVKGSSVSMQFGFPVDIDGKETKPFAAAAAAVVSRVTSSGVKVSTSYLLGNLTAQSIISDSEKQAFIDTALNSWGREQSDVILKGSIVG